MKIGLRVLLGYFVIVALAALLLGRVFVQQVKPGVRQAMEDTLADTANVLAELAADDLLAGRMNDGRFAQRVRALQGRDIGAEIWGFPKREASYRITVTDARGIVVFDSAGRELGRDNSRWNDVYRTLRGQYGARSTREVPGDDSTSVMYVAAPVRDAQGQIAGVLTVSKPNRAMAPFIARSQGVILRWGFVLLGVALLIGLLAAWWLSRQLGGLRRYADAVTAGERTTLPRSAGEFAALGRALQTMRDRLEGKQYVERYVHALTHELKSPLAAIRASAELLESPLPDQDRRRFAEAIGAQSERLTMMVDKLLALAAVEHRQRIEQPEPVDPAALVQAAAEDVRSQAQAAGVQLVVEAEEGMPALSGDRFLLRQMLVNLLDNAIDFSARGTSVEASVRRQDAGMVFIVADRGSGVPDYAVERVFERFYSLPRPGTQARSSGLGLSFVREVAALHGGRALLRNREGGGTVVEVVLPT
ncbi:MAG TPA: two-component system sensor histidine kinase CreC [Xanthomonadaceae bacterium]|nr:two-component system sensor histidine kinase CreC [Xanthomonadaceae bacterium]